MGLRPAEGMVVREAPVHHVDGVGRDDFGIGHRYVVRGDGGHVRIGGSVRLLAYAVGVRVGIPRGQPAGAEDLVRLDRERRFVGGSTEVRGDQVGSAADRDLGRSHVDVRQSKRKNPGHGDNAELLLRDRIQSGGRNDIARELRCAHRRP